MFSTGVRTRNDPAQVSYFLMFVLGCLCVPPAPTLLPFSTFSDQFANICDSGKRRVYCNVTLLFTLGNHLQLWLSWQPSLNNLAEPEVCLTIVVSPSPVMVVLATLS